jgi:hypothetical protein
LDSFTPVVELAESASFNKSRVARIPSTARLNPTRHAIKYGLSERKGLLAKRAGSASIPPSPVPRIPAPPNTIP